MKKLINYLMKVTLNNMTYGTIEKKKEQEHIPILDEPPYIKVDDNRSVRNVYIYLKQRGWSEYDRTNAIEDNTVIEIVKENPIDDSIDKGPWGINMNCDNGFHTIYSLCRCVVRDPNHTVYVYNDNDMVSISIKDDEGYLLGKYSIPFNEIAIMTVNEL